MRAAEWDQRYAENQQWSSGPNALVAELLEGVPAGDAVDLAAGEGRHALWLAGVGWRVTRSTSPTSASAGVARNRAPTGSRG